MPDLLHEHWLWLYGALSLGIAAGWPTSLLALRHWTPRLAHVAIGAAAFAVVLAVAKLVPARYGVRVELGVILALAGTIGGAVGWALRDLADFTPIATRPGAAGSAATSGSYLFRDALVGMGAGPAYMRGTTRQAAPPRRLRPVPSGASLAQAPAPGGYTFPKTLPFADATPRPQAPPTGSRRHWSWPV